MFIYLLYVIYLCKVNRKSIRAHKCKYLFEFGKGYRFLNLSGVSLKRLNEPKLYIIKYRRWNYNLLMVRFIMNIMYLFQIFNFSFILNDLWRQNFYERPNNIIYHFKHPFFCKPAKTLFEQYYFLRFVFPLFQDANFETE